MRRVFAPLLIVALLQTGCLGHLLAGIGAEQSSVDTYSVAPEEPDARLICGDASCSAAPVEQASRRGRSKGVFWGTFAGEIALGLYGIIGTFSSLGRTNPSINVPALVAFDLGFGLAMVDIIAYAVASDYGPQRDPARLARPMVADWRGMRVPLRSTDVVPFGAPPPKTFSVAAAAGRTPAPAQMSAAERPAAGGVKIARGKLAVLDLRCSAKEIPPDEVRYFGDLVRAATLKAAPQLEVMTRENLLVLLQSSGKDLANCEGGCEVDTGRRIGADAIVSGEVLKVGTRYKLTLRLHETQAGKLLGAAVASGRSIDELDDAVGKAAAELFGSGP